MAVICSLPCNDAKVWLCMDSNGEPYLDWGDGAQTRVRSNYRDSKYWLGALKSKNWSICRVNEKEMEAIQKAIRLLESNVKRKG